MNRDDIIRMAKEAGVWPQYGDPLPPSAVFRERQEKFAQLVAAHERKRCVEECSDIRKDGGTHKSHEGYEDGHLDACNECIWAIEALT